jgi:hypothetical protein
MFNTLQKIAEKWGRNTKQIKKKGRNTETY